MYAELYHFVTFSLTHISGVLFLFNNFIHIIFHTYSIKKKGKKKKV